MQDGHHERHHDEAAAHAHIPGSEPSEQADGRTDGGLTPADSGGLQVRPLDGGGAILDSGEILRLRACSAALRMT